MDSEITEVVRGKMYFTAQCRSYPKIVVHSVVQTLVQKTDPLLETPTPRGPWLRPDIAIVADELPRVGRHGDDALDHAVINVDEASVPVNKIGIGVIPIDRRDPIQRSRRQRVVAVEPADDIACGASQSFVDTFGLSAISLRDPIGELMGMVPQYIDGSVGRPAVDDHVFERGVFLFENRADRSLEERSLVERWRHYRDFRNIGHRGFAEFPGGAPIAMRVG